MDDQEILAPFIWGGEASSLLAVDARGMSLIHDQERIVVVRNRDQVFDADRSLYRYWTHLPECLPRIYVDQFAV